MQRWSQVENILCSIPIESIQIDNRMTINEDNILHFACRFDPPINIIRLLATKYPNSLLTPDATGRFAVHVASKYSASPVVIHFLISENFAAASVPDVNGKTPIHYVGQYYAKNHSMASIKDINRNMLQVVRLFKASAPESFNLEDNEECNAIEYALESNADIMVVKAMQQAARDDWREMRKKHGVSHEELARGIEKAAFKSRKTLLGSIDEDAEKETCEKPDLSVGRAVTDSSIPLASRSYLAKTA